MQFRSLLLPLWLVPLALAACASSDDKPDPKPTASAEGTEENEQPRGPAEPYIIRREQHETQLTERGPLTDKYPTFKEPPEGAVRVEYTSGDLTLWGFYFQPEDSSDADPVAGLVFLHGDFFLKPGDVDLIRPFVDAGFGVFLPTLRGRNGNPGAHELLYGEVDDAAAAVRWLAKRPEVDPTRVYSFGHSLGGGTSALLALDQDIPVAITASCGGVYSPDTFRRWAAGKGENTKGLVRFDVNDRDELELRVMAVHAEELAHRHIAYIGEKEKLFLENAELAKKNAERGSAPLEVVVVPGDHMSALLPALERFKKRIIEDAGY